MKVSCPYCGQRYEANDSMLGSIVNCEVCSKAFVLQYEYPNETFVMKKIDNPIIANPCPVCGANIEPGMRFCPHCRTMIPAIDNTAGTNGITISVSANPNDSNTMPINDKVEGNEGINAGSTRKNPLKREIRACCWAMGISFLLLILFATIKPSLAIFCFYCLLGSAVLLFYYRWRAGKISPIYVCVVILLLILKILRSIR